MSLSADVTQAAQNLVSGDLAKVTGFEAMTLANFSGTSTAELTYDIELNADNVAANSTLTVTSSYAGAKYDGTVNTLKFNAAALTNGTSKINFTGNAAYDSVTGGAGNDTINGGAGNDTISGGSGSDVLSGGDGEDSITAGSGNDNISGGNGADAVYMEGNLTVADTVGGGTGADTLYISDDSATDVDELDNVTGFETIVLQSAAGTEVIAITATADKAFAKDTAAVTIKARAAANTGTLALDMSKLTRAITLIGGTGNDTLTGGEGADQIDGGAGDDKLVGGKGNDVIIGGAGYDSIVAGDGNDTVTMSTNLTLADTVAGGDGTADVLTFTNPASAAATALDGVTGFETIDFTPVPAATSNVSNDRGLNTITLGNTSLFDADTTAVTLNVKADVSTVLTFAVLDRGITINGAGGADSITGGAGADIITGGAGDDILIGNGGADTITGGAGQDTITAGAGLNKVILSEATSAADTVVLTHGGSANVTSVEGFTTSSDVIQLTIGDITPTGATGAMTLAATNGKDFAAGTTDAAINTDVIVTAAKDAPEVDASGVSGTVKLTTGAASFADALGTTTIKLDVDKATNGANAAENANSAVEAGELIVVMWYDNVKNEMVFGAVDSASDGTIGSISKSDTFYEMARVAMTGTEFNTFNTTYLTFG